MIFGRGQILFIFCAFVFALHFSTLNAYYLNNNGYDVALKDDGGCFGCVGYVCLMKNGKIIEGKDCLENVVKFCQISKSDVTMLKNVVQEKAYEYKSETYFISSCQDNKGVNDEMEDQVNANMDQRREKRDNINAESCGDDPVFPNADEKVSDHKEFLEHATKCFFLLIERDYIKPIREAQNSLNDFKMAAEDILKTIDDANTTANEIKKFGDYFKKEVVEISQNVENVSTIISEVDEMLKTLNDSLFIIEKKCAEFDETSKACLNETFNCTLGQYFDATGFCDDEMVASLRKAEDYLKKAKELVKPLNELKPEAEKVFMEANVALTVQNALELAEKSKEIGGSSNKTANFAIEIGMEAKMAANESMKIGNEANQKVLEVEKFAKDSKKLAEKNQKTSDKTEAEVQKLKSNGGKNGCKFGIFGISFFAYIFLY